MKGLVVVGIALLMIVVMHGEKMIIEEVMMVAGVLAEVVVVKVVSVTGDNSNDSGSTRGSGGVVLP